jgi:plastocyanin
MIKSIVSIAFLMLIVFAFTNCNSDDDPVVRGDNEVWMQNNTFAPGNLTISAGTTVIWTNRDNMAHNVISNDGLWNSGTINAGGTFSFTFEDEQTYAYVCTLHPGMNGQIIVQ